MRRWVVHRFGGAERLTLEDAPDPTPGQGQARLAVRAIGLNFADLMERQGVYPNTPKPPFVPGMEISGVVDAVGPGADAGLVGRRVMAVPLFGGHAEKVCVDAAHVMELPDHATFAEGASFPVTYLTAQYALHELGRARPGEKVLLTAAAGGVGTAVLQLAAPAGVEVMAVVGSPGKHGLVRELGAAHVASYESCAADVRRIWGGVDIVLDSVGGKLFRPLFRQLHPGGRYVMFGFSNAATGSGISYLRALGSILSMGVLVPFQMVSANKSFSGFNLSAVPNQTQLLRDLAAKLLLAWGEGRVKPIIGRTFPFDQLPDAHRFLQSRASTGKVVVTVGT